MAAYLIPKRYFKNEIEINEFTETLRKKINVSKQ
ncbi:MAG: hypothetical protein K2X86_04275 [Cytophagaceae bacterium]|nr:hypothetical protein [Cytophagaceae bacterium]